MNLTDKEKLLIREISIERVINASLRFVDDVGDEDEFYDEAQVNSHDWLDAKPIVVKLWAEIREAIMKEMINA